VASSVHLVVHVATDPTGARPVRRIGGSVVETADLFTMREGRLLRADGSRRLAVGWSTPSAVGTEGDLFPYTPPEQGP